MNDAYKFLNPCFLIHLENVTTCCYVVFQQCRLPLALSAVIRRGGSKGRQISRDRKCKGNLHP